MVAVVAKLQFVCRIGRSALSFWLFCASVFAQVSQPSLQSGTVIPSVTCSANPKETYALYLPSSLSAERRWPIIYVFDPFARGQAAVEVVRAAAEKFSYIVVASNNSKNGPMGGSSEAATAIWQDTQQRFPIDPKRRYVAGLSGGARVATSIAIACSGCVAGVIANAAGFPPNALPARDMKFAYFAAVGDADFNYAEFAQLRPKLDEAGARYRIRIFSGTHGWAPAEVWQEALDWMDLQAMATGVLPRDQVRIKAALDEALVRAKTFEANNDLLAAFREYQSAIKEFHDLADISPARDRLAELQKNKRLKAAEKQEMAEIEQQERIEATPAAQMQKLLSGDLDAEGFTDLRSSIADLKRQSQRSGRESLVTRRAVIGLVVQAFESGQRSMEQKSYSVALKFFELAAAGSENPAGAHYERARVYALTSDKKDMLAELRLCLAAGVHNPSALDSAEFMAYRDQPEFRALLDEWKQKAQP